jgi:ribonucleotide reductase alpha subunit
MACARRNGGSAGACAGPYESYEGSPISRGILQFDMWTDREGKQVTPPSDRFDWEGLRAQIRAHGVRNSLLLAPMPTASTSQATRPAPPPFAPATLHAALRTCAACLGVVGLRGRLGALQSVYLLFVAWPRKAPTRRGWLRKRARVGIMGPGALPQILGNNECFEPYTSNIYVRRVLSGEFTVVNQHLLHDLTSLRQWSPDLKNELVAANGSVQVQPLCPPNPRHTHQRRRWLCVCVRAPARVRGCVLAGGGICC